MLHDIFQLLKVISAAMLRGAYECSALKGDSEVKKEQCEEISAVQWQSASEVK